MWSAFWSAVGLLLLNITIMLIVFGPFMYLGIKYFGKTKRKKNYPFREPAVFTNAYGHLIMIAPDPEMQEQVIQYFNENPEKKKAFLNDVRNPNSEEKW